MNGYNLPFRAGSRTLLSNGVNDNFLIRRSYQVPNDFSMFMTVSEWNRDKLMIAAAVPTGHHADTCDFTYKKYPDVTLPKFMIIGGLKTGSSYLHNILAQHPSLLASNLKEYYFFAENMLYQNKSLSEFNNIFPLNAQNKIPFYSPVGELRSISSAPRIRDVFPCMKFIIVMREPLSRSWSHFQMNLREGLISKNLLNNYESYTFEEIDILTQMITEQLSSVEVKQYINALPAEERKNLKSENLILKILSDCLLQIDPITKVLKNTCSILNLLDSPTIRLLLSHPISSLMIDGLYSEAILYWLQFFPRSQFHFIIAEDLFQNPSYEMQKVHQFLEIPDYTYSSDTLKTPVLVWGGIDNHNAPGDYGPPQIEEMELLYTFLNPFNKRLEYITGIPNITDRWNILNLYPLYKRQD